MSPDRNGSNNARIRDEMSGVAVYSTQRILSQHGALYGANTAILWNRGWII